MRHLDKIMELAEAELAEVVKNGRFRSREDIESVGYLIDIGKDIECMWDMEDGGYSGYGGYNVYPRNDGSYRGGSYDGSYASGRQNARRDSMGRYSRNYGRSYGYSMGSGKDEYVQHLHEMMENAPDDKFRMSIQNAIREIEST